MGEHAGSPPGLFEHEPAPAEPRKLIPDRNNFLMGLVLGLLAGALTAGDVFAVRRLGWFSIPLIPALGVPAFLAAWAALIHVTGGEKFDDHPWV